MQTVDAQYFDLSWERWQLFGCLGCLMVVWIFLLEKKLETWQSETSRILISKLLFLQMISVWPCFEGRVSWTARQPNHTSSAVSALLTGILHKPFYQETFQTSIKIHSMLCCWGQMFYLYFKHSPATNSHQVDDLAMQRWELVVANPGVDGNVKGRPFTFPGRTFYETAVLVK